MNMGTHRKLRFWTHSGVKVYDNTAAPTSWTDLDLSSIIGKNRALVYLKIKNRYEMYAVHYSFRTDGDGEEVGANITYAGGCTYLMIEIGYIGYLLVETSKDGIVDWKCNQASPVDIWVLGYVK